MGRRCRVPSAEFARPSFPEPERRHRAARGSREEHAAAAHRASGRETADPELEHGQLCRLGLAASPRHLSGASLSPFHLLESPVTALRLRM